jgi:hypothetical protein
MRWDGGHGVLIKWVGENRSTPKPEERGICSRGSNTRPSRRWGIFFIHCHVVAAAHHVSLLGHQKESFLQLVSRTSFGSEHVWTAPQALQGGHAAKATRVHELLQCY